MNDPIHDARQRCNQNAAQLAIFEDAERCNPTDENLREMDRFLRKRQVVLDQTLADLIEKSYWHEDHEIDLLVQF